MALCIGGKKHNSKYMLYVSKLSITVLFWPVFTGAGLHIHNNHVQCTMFSLFTFYLNHSNKFFNIHKGNPAIGC